MHVLRPQNKKTAHHAFELYAGMLVCLASDACITTTQVAFQNKGSLAHPKRMNFRKSSKRPLTPPPLILGKSYCTFFIMDMVAYMQGGMRAR